MAEKMQRKPLFERVTEGFEAALEHARGGRQLKVTTLERITPPAPKSAVDIRNLRQTLELTQEGLARVLSVSPSSVRSWEQGQRKPSGSVLRLLQFLEQADRQVLWSILQAPAAAPVKQRSRRRSVST